MKSVSIYLTELRSNMVWHLTWILTLITLLIFIIVIYPGDKAMQGLKDLLTQAYFQDLLTIGNIKNIPSNFTLWISVMIPFDIIIIFIYALMTGVRVSVQSISEGTGELLHTLPIKRNEFLIIRLFANFTPICIYFIIQFFIFYSKIFTKTLEYDALFTITWWGMLFCFFAVLLGIGVGLIVGNTTKGYQLSIIVSLICYGLKIVSGSNVKYSDLNNFNPLSYYQANQYLLFKSYGKNLQTIHSSINLFPLLKSTLNFSYNFYESLILILSALILLLVLYEFKRKDLTDDAGLHFYFIKRLQLKRTERTQSNQEELTRLNYLTKVFSTPFLILYHSISVVLQSLKAIVAPKNVRNNPFVFWARVFEKDLPITADFIYSDNVILFIAFIAIILFFPVQIAYYPGNQAVIDSASFANSGIWLVFSYGHNLLSTPYLWFIVINTLGITWLILMPLSFFWINKAIRRDANSGTGEIPGGIALDSRNVVLQRILAIFIELIVLVMIMIGWLLICEAITGKTYNKVWEVISLLAMIPFYMFIISFSGILSLYFRRIGGIVSGLFMTGIVFTFIISIINSGSNTWYMRGIFGLYDPVLIIENKSLLTNNYGIVILFILAILSIFGLVMISSKYIWLNITNKSKNPNS